MRSQLKHKTSRRGDTLIEVMLSISIFAMVALITINMMNDGINTAQRTLEAEMARNEIDGQSEALRFIHNNYVAERNMDKSQFRLAWNRITERASLASSIKDNEFNVEDGTTTFFDINNMESCEEAYTGGDKSHLTKFKAFIVNPRLLIPNNYGGGSVNTTTFSSEGIDYMKVGYEELLGKMLIYHNERDDQGKPLASKFATPSLYPRIIYKKLKEDNDESADERSLSDMGNIYNEVERAEGIWINAVGNASRETSIDAKRSDYYDFYIRTCWHSAGTRVPSTITTVVRLYNPEVME